MRRQRTLTVSLMGGLGNQLFIYYAALSFTKYFNRKLVFDVSDLNRIKLLHPGMNLLSLGMLESFEIQTQKWAKVLRFKDALIRKALSTLRGVNKKSKKNYYQSSSIGYVDPGTISKKTRKIHGYFQSYKYYDDLQAKLIPSIEDLKNPTGFFKDHVEEMGQCNPVVIHIRRGDYELPINRDIGTLSNKYYSNAIKLEMNRPIWLFSEDRESAEEVSKDLIGFDIRIVEPPDFSDPFESLILMSKASKIVISNSTFSWWSAKLSDKNTEVIAPSKWFKSRIDPEFLIPPDWVRIQSDWKKYD